MSLSLTSLIEIVADYYEVIGEPGHLIEITATGLGGDCSLSAGRRYSDHIVKAAATAASLQQQPAAILSLCVCRALTALCACAVSSAAGRGSRSGNVA